MHFNINFMYGKLNFQVKFFDMPTMPSKDNNGHLHIGSLICVQLFSTKFLFSSHTNPDNPKGMGPE